MYLDSNPLEYLVYLKMLKFLSELGTSVFFRVTASQGDLFCCRIRMRAAPSSVLGLNGVGRDRICLYTYSLFCRDEAMTRKKWCVPNSG